MNLNGQIPSFKKIVLTTLLFFVVIGFLPNSAQAVLRITKLTPSRATVGSKEIDVTITGTDFSDTSEVWSGIGGTKLTIINKSLPTTIIFKMPEDQLRSIGLLAILVQDPSGVKSNIVAFEVEQGWSLFPPDFKFFLERVISSTYLQPLRIVPNIIRISTAKSAEWGSNLLKYILTEITGNNKWAITRSCTTDTNPCPLDEQTVAGSAFLIIWEEVRNWANMLIVLGMIAIALATILRWPADWEAKKLLPVLLGVALLVNFSVVFVGVIIDVSNLIMQSILGTTNTASIDVSVIGSINKSWNEIDKVLPGVIEYASVSILFSILYFLVAVTMFWFSFIFIERYIMLAILFIVSPLVFVAYAFPKQRQYFSDWWKNLLKWCFIGIGAAFFMRLSLAVLARFVEQSVAISGGAGAGALTANAGLGGLSELLFRLLIVMLIMLTGLKALAKADGFAKAILAAVVAAIAAVVTGGASLLGTAAGGAAKMAGNTRPGNWAKEKVGNLRDRFDNRWARMREGVGLDDAGTAKAKEKERKEAAMKRYESIAKAEPSAEVLARGASNPKYSAAQRAAFTKELVSRGKTSSVKAPDAAAVIANAKQHYLDTSAFEKTNLNLVDLDRDKMNEEKKKIIEAKGSKFTEDAMKEGHTDYVALENEAVKRRRLAVIRKMSAEDARKVVHFTKDMIQEMSLKKLTKALEDIDGDRLQEIKDIRTRNMARFNTVLRPRLKAGTATPDQKVEAQQIRDLVTKIDAAMK